MINKYNLITHYINIKTNRFIIPEYLYIIASNYFYYIYIIISIKKNKKTILSCSTM